jgi:hypothetical protein
MLQAAQHLSPAKQLELIQAISQSPLRQYRQTESDAIPQHMSTQLAPGFWLADESVDDIDEYIAQQRHSKGI